MKKSYLFRWLSTAALALSTAGCPDKPALDPDGVKGKHHSGAEVRGSESVLVVEDRGLPLIVDWQPEQRLDLEVAMKQGVAVVSYDGKGLKLLSGCSIDGDYGFIGVPTKQHVVRLVTDEEAKANLPLGALGAAIGAELARGLQIEIAIVMVGQKRTTWAEPTRADLHGNCGAATHFVRGVTVGAFAMSSGRKDRARTVAQIFGVGASAGRSEESAISSTDGLFDHCEKADPSSSSAPPQCSALIRLEIVRIASEKPRNEDVLTAGNAATPATKELPVAEADACPTGMVFADGKCTREIADSTHVCRAGDVGDCDTQCAKGSAESCDVLGVMFARGDRVTKDTTKATALFLKACQGDSAHGCANLGIAVQNGMGVAKNPEGAVVLYKKACDAGEPLGCYLNGMAAFYGNGVQQDHAESARLFNRACAGGNMDACSDLGFQTTSGDGVTKDHALAAKLFKRACDGGVAYGCGNLGYLQEFGHGTPKDLAATAQNYLKTCEMDRATCSWLGVLMQVGKGLPQDAARAKQAFALACNAGDAMSCGWLNVVHGEKHQLDMERVKDLVTGWTGQCKGGVERDCTAVAVLAFALGQNEDGHRLAGHGCKLGDEWACDLVKHAPSASQ